MNTGKKSLDEKYAMMNLLNILLNQWNAEDNNPKDFGDTLKMFKQNLEKHISFLEEAAE